MRLGTGQSGATLATCILRDGSPRPQADMWSSESTANPTSSPGLLLADDTASTANKRFNIDEVNCRLVDPAVALTRIGADIETGGPTP